MLVLDIMLSEIDGFIVCREICKESYLPIVMVKALGSPEDRRRGLEVGADDYLVKPFSSIEMIEHVNVILNKRMGRSLNFSN